MKKKGVLPITLTIGLKGGWQFRIRVEQHKDHLTTETGVLRNGRPATKREAELWREVALTIPAILVKELARAAGEEKIATELAEWLDQYKKATYPCRSPEPSPEREKAISFLRAWRRETRAAEERGQKVPDTYQMKLLSPLLTALKKLNAEFFEGLAESIQVLSDRICNSKDGSGEDLNKWLLEYKLMVGPPKHAVRELNEQFVSKFRSISDAKLRAKCHKLGIPLKEDVRGAGAVRRKMRSNGTRSAEKGLIG
jgi:hypothetical protein